MLRNRTGRFRLLGLRAFVREKEDELGRNTAACANLFDAGPVEIIPCRRRERCIALGRKRGFPGRLRTGFLPVIPIRKNSATTVRRNRVRRLF